MYKHPNPMDPLDGVKRWYRELWPIERAAVIVCLAAVIYLMGLWVTN